MNLAKARSFSSSGASSEDEAIAPASQEPLTLPSAMNHRQIVFHKRAASLYFALKSSSKFLFFTMIALVLRSVGLSPLRVGILRALSALYSIMFVEFVVICISSPRKRKILAHLCLVLASASVLAYLVIPAAYEMRNSTSLMPQHCHIGNYSLNVNRTHSESDDTDDLRSPPPTEPSPVISISELGTAANIVTGGPRTVQPTNPGVSELTYVPSTQQVNSISPVGNIKENTQAPPIFTRNFPNRGGVEPDWVKEIIHAQNNGVLPLKRRERAVPGVVTEDRSAANQQQQQQQVAAIELASESQENPRSETSLDESPRFTFFENIWEEVREALAVADSPHSLLVACFLLVSLEAYFGIIDRVSIRLYTNYLDQVDKSFDHLPFSHFATLFTLVTAVIVYVRFQCSVAPNLELPTALLGTCAVVLGLASLVFTCFPVPEKRKILDRDSASIVKLTVYGNFRAMLIFLTLIVLGAAFGVEQNFLLWHLVDNGANIAYITAFVGIPVLISALLIGRTPKRIRNIHRFLLAALFSVSIRFVSYSFYSESNVKWSVLLLQVVAPLSSSLLWKALDSFLQQITFPNDHAPISRSMRFAFWGLGFASGSLIAGYAWQVDKPSFFLLVVGVAVGSMAIVLLAINSFVRIQDMKEAHYMRVLETDHQSKQPINHFEETDDSDDEENDQVVEFQVTSSNRS